MNENKSVAVKDETAMTLGDRMASAGIDAKDLVPSRLVLMQNTSEQVGEDVFKLGDIVHTTNNEAVGGFDKPVEIIPMSLYKTLLTQEVVQGGVKFLKQEPLTAENEQLPWEGTDKNSEGKTVPVKRATCFNFFALIASEVAEEEAFPVVIRFKVTSIHAGKQLATHIFKRTALGQAPYSQTVMLGSKKEKNGTNAYGVYTISKGRKATDAEVAAAKLWYGATEAMKPKVHDFDEVSEKAPQAAPTVAESSPEDAERF